MSSPGDRVTRWRWLLPTNRLGPADYDIWAVARGTDGVSLRFTPAVPRRPLQESLGKGTGGPQGRRGKAPIEISANFRSEIFGDRLRGPPPSPPSGAPPPKTGEERIRSRLHAKACAGILLATPAASRHPVVSSCDARSLSGAQVFPCAAS